MWAGSYSRQTVGKVVSKVDNVRQLAGESKQMKEAAKNKAGKLAKWSAPNRIKYMPSGSVCPTWPNLLLIFLIILPKVRSFVRTFAPIARLHSSHCHCHRLSTWCFIAHLVRCRISPYFRPFSPTLQANISGLTWMAKMFAIRCLMQCNVNEVNSICRHAFRSPLFHSFYWPERVSHLLGF